MHETGADFYAQFSDRRPLVYPLRPLRSAEYTSAWGRVTVSVRALADNSPGRPVDTTIIIRGGARKFFKGRFGGNPLHPSAPAFTDTHWQNDLHWSRWDFRHFAGYRDRQTAVTPYGCSNSFDRVFVAACWRALDGRSVISKSFRIIGKPRTRFRLGELLSRLSQLSADNRTVDYARFTSDFWKTYRSNLKCALYKTSTIRYKRLNHSKIAERLRKIIPKKQFCVRLRRIFAEF